MKYNAADFDSLADAIRAATGRKLYIPYDVGGKHTSPGWFAPDANGWLLDKPIEIYGDGRIGEDVALRFWADPNIPELYGTDNSTLFTLSSSNIYLHDLCLSNDRGFRRGIGDGIRQAPDCTIWSIAFERVNILYAGRYGIGLLPSPGQFSVGVQVKDCVSYGAGKVGVVFDQATTAYLEHVSSVHSGENGIIFTKSTTSRILDCGVEWSDDSPEYEPIKAAAIYINESSALTVHGHVEQFARKHITNAIQLDNCASVKIEPSGLFDYHGKKDLIGVELRNSRCCVVEPQMTDGVDIVVDATYDCRDNTIFRQPRGKIKVSSRNNIILKRQ